MNTQVDTQRQLQVQRVKIMQLEYQENIQNLKTKLRKAQNQVLQRDIEIEKMRIEKLENQANIQLLIQKQQKLQKLALQQKDKYMKLKKAIKKKQILISQQEVQDLNLTNKSILQKKFKSEQIHIIMQLKDKDNLKKTSKAHKNQHVKETKQIGSNMIKSSKLSSLEDINQRRLSYLLDLCQQSQFCQEDFEEKHQNQTNEAKKITDE